MRNQKGRSLTVEQRKAIEAFDLINENTGKLWNMNDVGFDDLDSFTKKHIVARQYHKQMTDYYWVRAKAEVKAKSTKFQYEEFLEEIGGEEEFADFEGEEEGMDDMDMGDEEEMGDVEGGEEEEADLEELSNHGVGKSAKNSSGPNAGFTPAKSTKGDSKLHEGKSALQARFQKLANIIK